MKRGTSGTIIRRAAAGILAVAEHGTPLDGFLDGCPPEIRRSVSHLLFCYFRFRRFLDAQLARFVSRPPKPAVYALLRAAATQLCFQNAIAPESAVNVAVDAAKREHAEKFVNAVLHRVLENRAAPLETPEELLPPELLAAWKNRFTPDELGEQLEILLTEPLFSFRMCRDFSPPADAAALPGWGGFRFFGTGDPAGVLASPAFRRGEIYVQDPATSLAPSLPDYTQINSALELCAAPGGKTLMVAERLRPGARLVAADRSAARQELTRSNCALRGVAAEIVAAEPREISGSFDLVLADVPCGNSGVFRRRPDAMWRYSPERQRELVSLQRAILGEAARLTAPGGQLVYATCSIEPEENDLNVAAFLETHPEFQLLRSRLLLPSHVNDGAFAALLIRQQGKR